MHLFPLIGDLAVILGVASLISILFHRIRQPAVLGYLIAGVIVGPHTPPLLGIADYSGIQVWSELGVIFMMFSLGLEFSLRKLASVGKTALFTGPFEALFMLILGYGATRWAGWSRNDSLFLGAMLSISSTIIIIKSLEDLRLKPLHSARVIFGILIIEDLVGILILIALSTLAQNRDFSGILLFKEFLKMLLIVSSWVLVGNALIPRFLNYVGSKTNDETLTTVSLALCLSLVTLAARLHYSTALGAFIMGSLFSKSKEIHRIERLVKPLRDVFAAVFFVSIGMLLNPMALLIHWKAVLAISILTLFGKIVSTTLGAFAVGQNWRTSLQAGLSLAQVGEFSFIIAGIGTNLGVMSPFLYPVILGVCMLTTFTTPYLIRLSHRQEIHSIQHPRKAA